MDKRKIWCINEPSNSHFPLTLQTNGTNSRNSGRDPQSGAGLSDQGPDLAVRAPAPSRCGWRRANARARRWRRVSCDSTSKLWWKAAEQGSHRRNYRDASKITMMIAGAVWFVANLNGLEKGFRREAFRPSSPSTNGRSASVDSTVSKQLRIIYYLGEYEKYTASFHSGHFVARLLVTDTSESG